MSETERRIVDILIAGGLFNGEIEDFSDEIFSDIFKEIDSLSLINFIVELENQFEIELPDIYLNPESFHSLKATANLIDELI